VDNQRVFSGIQPSGDKLHLGNYLGAVEGMLELQSSHDCIFSVVDYHAITVPYDRGKLPERVLNVAMEMMAAGLDPERSILMVQSDVHQHVEMCWLLSCLTTVNRLGQLPTYKDKVARGSIPGLGLLSYPVLMAADILLYKAELVPVGQDQLPHIEFTREVARAFNRRFGELLPQPQAHLTSGAVVPSLNGQGAMAKSLPGSYIALADEPETIAAKLAKAVTDPARMRRTDAGEPTRCTLYELHQLYTPTGELAGIAEGCRTAQIGCVQCKAGLAGTISASREGFRRRRCELAANPSVVMDALQDGASRARPIAEATMAEVKEAMGIARPQVLVGR
jgi:tryptophanyl-tRNA synthetase